MPSLAAGAASPAPNAGHPACPPAHTRTCVEAAANKMATSSQLPAQPVSANNGRWLTTEWTRFAARLIINGIAHPIEHAKVLIQLGHEPLEPYESHTLLGSPGRALPNVFQYVAFMRREYGASELYRGVIPKLSSNIVSAVVYTGVSKKLNNDEDFKNCENTQEMRLRAFVRRMARDAAARMMAIVLSHPLHVIAIRAMAQTVGGETRYSGISAPIAVYQDSGIEGFFQGMTPRLAGELLTLCISTLLTIAVNAYVADDRDMRFYMSTALSYLSTALTYPFQVVTTCMAASNSGLEAVSPARMPQYENWWQCWDDLRSSGQLGRGGGLFWRFVPHTSVPALIHHIPQRRRRFTFFGRKSDKDEL